MFLKTRGRLQNAFGSTPEEVLADAQVKIDAALPSFEAWADQAQNATIGASETLEGGAADVVNRVRSVLTHKGTHFDINRTPRILFTYGADVPEHNLKTLEAISEDIQMAAVRLDLLDGGTEEQAEALKKARESFSTLLDHYQSVIDTSKQTLSLPSVAGMRDSLTSKARHAMFGDINFTVRSHEGMIERLASRAGLPRRNAPNAGPDAGVATQEVEEPA